MLGRNFTNKKSSTSEFSLISQTIPAHPCVDPPPRSRTAGVGGIIVGFNEFWHFWQQFHRSKFTQMC